jgi:AraC-like DNA-binding protein
MKQSAPAASGNGPSKAARPRAGLRLAEPRDARAPRTHDPDGPDAQSLRRLATLVAAHTPYDGFFQLRLPGVHVVRRSRVTREPVRATATPGLCIVAQGSKIAMLGREVYSYNASQMIAYSVVLPVASQVVRATPVEPFLALKLDLDPYRIAELTLKVFPHGIPSPHESRGVFVEKATTAMVAAASRLIELMATPADTELLAPLVVEEMLIRLLRSPIGPRVAQIGHKDSGVQRVAKAVTWVRDNFAQSMSVDDLADMAHMSPSSFHQHFRAVTSMSPLQYQKVLRLQEARRLMLSQMMDAGGAGRHVGYLSASQFSREYTRLFGNAPMKDIAQLRRGGLAVEEVGR